MTGMENSDMHQVVANLQAVIEYKEEELRIYRKKTKRTLARNVQISQTTNAGAWRGKGRL